jgi:hypothetical protein
VNERYSINLSWEQFTDEYNEKELKDYDYMVDQITNHVEMEGVGDYDYIADEIMEMFEDIKQIE